MKMTKTEKLELAQIIAEAVVTAMKATTETPTSANEGKKTKSANKGRGSATINEGKKTKTHKPYSGNTNEPSEQDLLLEAFGKKGRGSATATKYSTKIADYEPKKVDGFYKWGKKTDTMKSKNYRAMQIAYCYAVATKGQAVSSDECFNLGIEVDYSEGSAYGKAKAQFKKKFVYIKKADR